MGDLVATVSAQWKGDQAFAKISGGARLGNARSLMRLKALSEPLVPYEFGALVGSAAVEQYDGNGDLFADGLLAYDTAYAVYVHEIERYKHPTGQAKFLSEPLETDDRDLLAIMAAEVRRALTG